MSDEATLDDVVDVIKDAVNNLDGPGFIAQMIVDNFKLEKLPSDMWSRLPVGAVVDVDDPDRWTMPMRFFRTQGGWVDTYGDPWKLKELRAGYGSAMAVA